MSSLSPGAPPPTDRRRALSALAALSCAVAAGALLWHLLYRGIPHSYDPMTYSRSVWGIAHGDFFNTVVFTPAFGIHGQFVLLLLSPLAWLMAPAVVLVVAQAAALGATVWLAAEAFGDACGERHAEGAAVLGAVLVALGSPLVLNGFLFDVRPEMLGIPLVLAGVLRCERREELDATALALMLSSLAAREDYAIFVAPALLLMPVGKGLSARARVGAAALGLAYLALYVLVVRRLLGGVGLVHAFGTIAANMVDPAADSRQAATLSDLVRYKAEILLVAAASVGGFAFRGGRWLLLAAPGLLFLLAQNRLQPWVLNTHYAIFAAPGLVAAGVAGYRRWVRQGRPRPVATTAIAILAAAGSFLLSSAAPGGGRYIQKRFGWSLARPTEASGVPAALVPIRKMLDAVPKDAGLAVPYVFGPPLAGRRDVYALESLPREMQAEGRVPDGVEWVALPPQHWGGFGRALVERGGFVVHGLVPGAMALLSREKAGRIPARDLAAAMPQGRCRELLATWTDVGLDLCGVRPMGDGRLVALIRRRPDAPLVGRAGVALQAVEDGSHLATPLRILDGMLPIPDLPPGVEALAFSDRRTGASSGQVVLLDAGERKRLPARRAGTPGVLVEEVPVAWGPPPSTSGTRTRP